MDCEVIVDSPPDFTLQKFLTLDLRSTALLFDVDGTLIDIGASPFDVDVPAELCRALERLRDKTAGALALVSGRPIADLDKLFHPLKLPSIGGHGAEMRLRDGASLARIEKLPEALRRQLIAAVTPDSGIEYEDKGYSVALHYRGAPEQAERLRRHIAAGRAAFPNEATQLLLGKAMLEVKRPGVDKGEAVRALMQEPPFAGRTPVFIGDDVTDESVFKLLPEIGGIGFSVGHSFAGIAGAFASPGDVRDALRRLAERDEKARA